MIFFRQPLIKISIENTPEQLLPEKFYMLPAETFNFNIPETKTSTMKPTDHTRELCHVLDDSNDCDDSFKHANKDPNAKADNDKEHAAAITYSIPNIPEGFALKCLSLPHLHLSRVTLWSSRSILLKDNSG